MNEKKIEEIESEELSKQILKKIQTHITKPQHPVTKYLDTFKKVFLGHYKGMVDNTEKQNKALVEKIEAKGKDFVTNIYKGVNDFMHSLFETLIVMYDPNQDGFLEDIERDIDKTLLQKTIGGEVYFVLIVLSRIFNKDKDKDLRFKS